VNGRIAHDEFTICPIGATFEELEVIVVDFKQTDEHIQSDCASAPIRRPCPTRPGVGTTSAFHYNLVMDAAARDRAAERRLNARRWPVRSYAITDEPIRDPFDRSTVDERLAAMWPLAKEAWSVAGKAIPDYERSAAPGRLVRQGT
jgi:hypothetical protein